MAAGIAQVVEKFSEPQYFVAQIKSAKILRLVRALSRSRTLSCSLGQPLSCGKSKFQTRSSDRRRRPPPPSLRSHGPRRCCECRRKAKLGHPLSSFGCSPFAFAEEMGRKRERESEQTNGHGRGRGRQSGPNICSRSRVVGASIATTSTEESSCSVRFYAVREKGREEDFSMLKSELSHPAPKAAICGLGSADSPLGFSTPLTLTRAG